MSLDLNRHSWTWTCSGSLPRTVESRQRHIRPSEQGQYPGMITIISLSLHYTHPIVKYSFLDPEPAQFRLLSHIIRNGTPLRLRKQHALYLGQVSSIFKKSDSWSNSVDYNQSICFSFAKDYKIPTLIAVGSYADYQNSMRGHMPSFLDILKVNKYYKCDRK